MSSRPIHFPDGPEQRTRDDAIREAMAAELERQYWTGTRTSGLTPVRMVRAVASESSTYQTLFVRLQLPIIP